MDFLSLLVEVCSGGEECGGDKEGPGEGGVGGADERKGKGWFVLKGRANVAQRAQRCSY